MNYFAHQTAAERYAKSRPRFHSVIIDRMKTGEVASWIQCLDNFGAV